MSNFGGSAWELDAHTGQYYLHLFLREQPDLNWGNPDVVEAMHEVLRFWLDRGVDGFRIDVAHAMAKDPQLRDNPPNPDLERAREVLGRRAAQFLPVYSQNRPEVHDIHRGFRRLLDQYSAEGSTRVSVGEVYLMDVDEMAKYFGNGKDELHLAFNFSFLWSRWGADRFGRRIARTEDLLNRVGAWPTYTLSNHDHSRHATRYGPDRVAATAMMLLTLRGSPFIYYGEELGMEDVAEAGGHDPMARDPERTPMRWDGSPNGGFTTGQPWLPLCPPGVNVEAQTGDPESPLSFYRHLLALRRRLPALRAGEQHRLDAPEDVLAWTRGDAVDVAINMGDTAHSVRLEGRVVAATERPREGETVRGEVVLAPDEGVVVERP